MACQVLQLLKSTVFFKSIFNIFSSLVGLEKILIEVSIYIFLLNKNKHQLGLLLTFNRIDLNLRLVQKIDFRDGLK